MSSPPASQDRPRPVQLDGSAPGAPVIVWFRHDLRLADNPALAAAAASGRPVLPIFILDRETPGIRKLGGAAQWWLAGSLEALGSSIRAKGTELHVFAGEAARVLRAVAAAISPAAVYWNRRYDAAEQALDATIKADLAATGVHVESFNSHLLNEPWQVSGKSAGPVKVFTPYWRAARGRGEPAAPLPAPAALSGCALPEALRQMTTTVEALGLRPVAPDWAGEMATLWHPGEAGARAALGDFLDGPLRGYGERRNRPDMASTSRLSPHLRFGEIGPRQIWHAAKAAFESGHTRASSQDVEKFLSEVGWREFAYHLLHHNPKLAEDNFQRRFDTFPWRRDDGAFRAWTMGRTGYPIVDAGMRELWRTGWMHNRVRMVAASFLIKHLLIDWRQGEEWFWDTLLDADPANNAASWQWVAGSGADAAPYFRIFAPVLQGEKFDPDGAYVRKYVPELAKLSNAWIHRPWQAPHAELARAGITLGSDYPHPIVVHEDARERALAAFRSISVDMAD